MTNEEISMNTKKKLSQSLKRHMQKKKLNKITVSDIVQDCQINRKTFYYHFKNIPDLVKWMLEEEAIEIVKKFDLMSDYEEAIIFVIEYVEQNAHILSCAYDAIGREEMKKFFYQDFIGIFEVVISSAKKELHVSIDCQFEQFLCDFYTEALASCLINLFSEKKKYDKKQIIDYIILIFQSAIPAILKTAAIKNQTNEFV